MEHFEEYKKQGEPEKSQKAENWGVAIGLQQVDNLTPSKYLIEVAKNNIEGKISIDEAGEQVSQYYKKNPMHYERYSHGSGRVAFQQQHWGNIYEK